MKKIAIVLGEPNSINSEILAKSWSKFSRNLKKKIFVIGSNKLLLDQFNRLNIRYRTNIIRDLDEKFYDTKINIMNVNLTYNYPFNVKKKNSEDYIKKCLDIACNFANNSKISSFLNCPIEKSIFRKNKGVTEYVSSKNKKNGIMMIYNEIFSVSPLTNHSKIRDLGKLISQNLIKRKVINLKKSYQRFFKKNPKIVILGLNPHLGELDQNSEEKKIIIPAINYLKRKKVQIKGPFSVDQIFLNKKYNFDIVVGMYHDQVIGPFKTLFGFNAVNLTLGLDFLRASPDHGTAKNLINKKKGNPISLYKSINLLKRLNG